MTDISCISPLILITLSDQMKNDPFTDKISYYLFSSGSSI